MEDPLISAKHCIIKVVEKKIFVMDCGTKNGTFCNGKKVQMCNLNVDDVLTIGNIWISLDTSKMTVEEIKLHSHPATKKEQRHAQRTLTAFSGLLQNINEGPGEDGGKNSKMRDEEKTPHISVGKIKLDDRNLRAKQLKANHKERKKLSQN